MNVENYVVLIIRI